MRERDTRAQPWTTMVVTEGAIFSTGDSGLVYVRGGNGKCGALGAPPRVRA